MNADARLDPLHEQAIEAACDLDRAYFDEHPEAEEYIRRAVDHELCGPFPECFDYARTVIRVMSFGPGVRARMPIAAGGRA
jgi:hypothetical protein